MSERTLPEVFIIESLTLDDEANERTEGRLLAQMLKLAGKANTKYFYIRTAQELEEIIDLFEDSNYRYLHLSCHGDTHGMSTTFDEISYHQLGDRLGPCLSDRRVFVSACEMANDALAGKLLKNTGCYSLIGPADKIRFDDAAAFWLAFYHLIFKHNDQAMKHEQLRHYVGSLSKLFEESINYYRHSTTTSGFERVTLA